MFDSLARQDIPAVFAHHNMLPARKLGLGIRGGTPPTPDIEYYWCTVRP